MEHNESQHVLYTINEIIFKLIIDINAKARTIKLPEESIGESWCDLEAGINFLVQTLFFLKG